MVFFTMAMYMFIGGFYPSERLVFGWYWSLTHHTTSLLLSLFSAVYIYENFLEIHWNRLVGTNRSQPWYFTNTLHDFNFNPL
jgi:hypothetical protein